MAQSGLAVSSGMGTGWAQTFGESTFDPVKFMDDLAEEKKAADAAKAKAEIDRLNKNRAFMRELKPGDVNLWNKEQMEGVVKNFEKQMTDLSDQGIDLEMSEQGRRAMSQGLLEVSEAQNLGKLIEEADKKNLELIKNDPLKYDIEQYNNWKEQVKGKGSLKEAAEYATTTSPFTPEFDEIGFVKDMVEDVPLEKWQIALTRFAEQKEEDAKPIITEGIDSLLRGSPTEKKMLADDVQSAYDAGKIKENTVDAYKEFVWDLTKPYLRKEVEKLQPRAAKGGGAGPKPTTTGLVFAQSPRYPIKGVDVNVVNLQEVPPTQFKKLNGETVYIKPEVLYRGKASEKAEEGWVIEGKTAKRKTGDQVEREAKQKGLDAEKYKVENYQQNPDNPNEYLSIKETEPIKLPFSNQPGTTGEFNYNTLTSIFGKDIYSEIEAENEARRKAGGGKQKESSGTTDLSGAFGKKRNQ